MGTYGYVRVSTKEQNEDRQIIAMREFGVQNDSIIMDKQSGKDFDRPGYRQLVRKLKAGDTLVIKSIDRLGRSYEEILENIKFRDNNDKTSLVAPLKQAEDAVYVDTTNLTIDKVVDKIEEIILSKK